MYSDCVKTILHASYSRLPHFGPYSRKSIDETQLTELGMEPDKVAAAVQRCLADAARSQQSFRTVNEFLASLKLQNWSDEDRLAVQTQVLAALKQRRLSQPPTTPPQQ